MEGEAEILHVASNCHYHAKHPSDQSSRAMLAPGDDRSRLTAGACCARIIFLTLTI
jgi:hypothetical protein